MSSVFYNLKEKAELLNYVLRTKNAEVYHNLTPESLFIVWYLLY
jgi:hypothetical protein